MFLKYTLYLCNNSPPVSGLEPCLQKISLKSSDFYYIPTKFSSLIFQAQDVKIVKVIIVKIDFRVQKFKVQEFKVQIIQEL